MTTQFQFTARQIEIIYNMFELVQAIPTGADELLDCTYAEYTNLKTRFNDQAQNSGR